MSIPLTHEFSSNILAQGFPLDAHKLTQFLTRHCGYIEFFRCCHHYLDSSDVEAFQDAGWDVRHKSAPEHRTLEKLFKHDLSDDRSGVLGEGKKALLLVDINTQLQQLKSAFELQLREQRNGFDAEYRRLQDDFETRLRKQEDAFAALKRQYEKENEQPLCKPQIENVKNIFHATLRMCAGNRKMKLSSNMTSDKGKQQARYRT
ncbi:hypothetical protein PPTG_21825 [Phytophthora nicotianae INRA-310]|uniref:Uncharacterized protein n=1 Tax=Phytophthora nicotianae (strain INRA-310) TaxID=761204 RepID=W2QUD3_PHYN3|nr:hypothetical protein PPTG_21825 [Phytophthora nicotianae INRA-310]ETN15870.1 hypothetical protein PPTG_21825 [Phytophthora nicotianae INRA-310]